MNTRLTSIAQASLLALCSLGLSVAHAQNTHAQAEPASATASTLPPVVVDAKPVIEEVRVDTFSSVSAITTEDQLRDQNALDLTSALRRTPGVQTSRFNPVGAFGGSDGGGIFIRGMGASRPGSEIKTYIDGVPFYMGVWNHPLLDLLPINGMRSITVHKSPQPHISGNNFASVNLQTRRASEEGVHGDARITAGSFHTFTEQVNLMGKHGKLDWMLAQGHAQSRGHRTNARGRLNNAMGRIGLQLNENWSLGASFLAVDNQSRDPGDNRFPAPARAQEFNTQGSTFSAEVTHQHGNWQGAFKVFSSQGKGRWLHQPAPDGDTISRFKMAGVRWREQLSPWQGGTITAGLDYDQVSGKVHFNRTPPARHTTFDTPTFRLVSPYVALSQQIDLGRGWSLLPSAGVRFYHSNQFDSEWAPHAGVSLVSDKLTVFANASRGINYPGLETTALAFNIPALRASWKQLQAEEMDHAEIGFKFAPTQATQIDASVFRDKVKNRYVFGFPPNVAPPPKFINLGSYHVKGAEFAVRQDIGEHWSVFAGLTLLDPSISHLPYTPKRALSAGVNGRIGPVRLALDAQHQSETHVFSNARRAGSVNTQKADGFTVANMRLSYPIPALGKKGEVFVAVENLFDKNYAYRPGYPMPGRWAQVGLAASF